jgi:hypothetical protein
MEWGGGGGGGSRLRKVECDLDVNLMNGVIFKLPLILSEVNICPKTIPVNI